MQIISRVSIFLLLSFLSINLCIANADIEKIQEELSELTIENKVSNSNDAELFYQSLALLKTKSHFYDIDSIESKKYKLLCKAINYWNNNETVDYSILIFSNILNRKLYENELEKNVIQVHLSRCYSKIGLKEKSKEITLDVFPKLIEGSELDVIKFNLSNIGYLNLIRNNDFQNALNFAKQTLAYCDKEDKKTIADWNNNIGVMLERLGLYKQAIEYFKANTNEDLLQISPIIYSYSFGNIGNSLYKLGYYKEAINNAKKELQIQQDGNFSSGEHNIKMLLALCYSKLNIKDSTIFYFEEALEVAIKNEKATEVYRVYKTILKNELAGRFFAKREDFMKGFLKYEAENILEIRNDQKTLEKNLKRINSTGIKNLVSANVIEKNREEKERLSNYIIWLTVGLIILLLILIWGIRSRKVLNSTLEILNKKNNSLSETNELIKKINNSNELLLMEVHHRVKNNLQILSSLFNLQSNSFEDPKIKNALADASSRVNSMAAIHESMYSAKDYEEIYLEDYILKIIEDISRVNSRKCNKLLSLEKLYVSIIHSIPLALIINELVTNSFKYASNEREDLTIKISGRFENEKYIINYSDNGPGLKDKKIDENTESIGFMLIYLLSKQIDSSFEIINNQPGFNCRLTLSQKIAV